MMRRALWSSSILKRDFNISIISWSVSCHMVAHAWMRVTWSDDLTASAAFVLDESVLSDMVS